MAVTQLHSNAVVFWAVWRRQTRPELWQVNFDDLGQHDGNSQEVTMKMRRLKQRNTTEIAFRELCKSAQNEDIDVKISRVFFLETRATSRGSGEMVSWPKCQKNGIGSGNYCGMLGRIPAGMLPKFHPAKFSLSSKVQTFRRVLVRSISEFCPYRRYRCLNGNGSLHQ